MRPIRTITARLSEVFLSLLPLVSPLAFSIASLRYFNRISSQIQERQLQCEIAPLARIELHIEPQTPVMVADAKLLFRVFSNLLSLSPRYSSRHSLR